MNPDDAERFLGWQQRVGERVAEHPLEMIYWEATRACDLSCLHCGSPSETWVAPEQLATDEVVSIFRQIAETFEMTHFKFVSITGGEPFVRSDLETILRELQTLGYEIVTIQTNGNRVARDAELFRRLLDLNLRGLGTNLDGLEPTHNLLRNHPDSFRNAVKAAELAVQHRAEVHSTISTVISAKNVSELPELARLIRSIGPHRWRLMTFDPIGRGAFADEWLLSPEQFREAVQFIAADRLEYIDQPEATQIELACTGWLGAELEGRVRPYVFHCVSGINTLGILYDGKLASCPNVPRDFIEGDARTESIREVWETRYQRYREFEWKRVGPCAECDQWDYCHGGPMHKRLAGGGMLGCNYQLLRTGRKARSCGSNLRKAS